MEVTTEEKKIEFSAEQQEHINKLFTDRFGKISGKHDSEMKAMADKLEEMKKAIEDAGKKTTTTAAAAGSEPNKDDDESKKQMKALLDAEKANTTNMKSLLDVERTEKLRVIEENKRILKAQAINDAALGLPGGIEFYELSTVKKLTEDNIAFDVDSNQWVVKENGTVKMNSSLLPMTLTEYFTAFAAERPYLVKGTNKSGTGSAESGRGNANAGGTGVVRSRADLKTVKAKVDFIDKFGFEKWEELPIK